MAHNFKQPPLLGPDTVYDVWRTEISIWRLVTDLKPPKQGLALALTLTGDAKAKALEIDVADLSKDTGLDAVLEALDTLFKTDTIDAAYAAYSDFDKFKKTEEMNMNEYIIQYERKYTKCVKFDMKLPDSVLAFKLLDNANLQQRDRQLILTAATDRTFGTMKSSLKRIFGDCGRISEPITIKEESAYMMKNYDRYRNRQRNTFPSGQQNRYQNTTPQKGTNPIDKFGKRSRCMICQSTFHWIKDCPHKEQEVKLTTSEQYEEKCNLTLFTKEEETESQVLLTEALGCAVLDTACTKTVCGKKWLDNYVENLENHQRKKVSMTDTNRKFRFGDGKKVHSIISASIPAKIGNTQCQIETEVVDADIPLLLSKDSLKRAKTQLNIQDDEASMFGEPVELQFTSSGHYCVKLQDDGTTGFDEVTSHSEEDEQVMFLKDNLSDEELRKILTKLHKQFGHASTENLTKLITKAGHDTSGMVEKIDKIVERCDHCIKYRKTPAKPVVSVPLATDFNDVVAVDLHELGKNIWYLHIIDHFTRFSAGAIVKDKKATTFVQKFIQHWICIHGSPAKLLSDNGGEFNNKEVQEMCENFNIEVKTTPGYSPWSNGLVERHNQTLTTILQKTKDDQGCDWDTALAWALAAKNSLCNVHGFSAYQLVYGRNPNLPSILVDKPPALEGTTSSVVVGKHVGALYASRKAFTEAECSERLRRALRKQIRPVTGPYTLGDKIYYKHHDRDEWKGPATVIGQDGVVVFVRQGGLMVRVHQNRMRKVNHLEETSPKDTEGNIHRLKTPELPKKTQRLVETEDSDLPEENVQDQDLPEETQQTEMTRRLRAGDVIKYKHMDTNEEITARITGRAGKARGKNKSWYNAQYVSPERFEGVEQSIDLDTVTDLAVENNHEHAQETEDVMVLEDISWEGAKLIELESWKRNQVYQEIEDRNQRCISTRWICTLKETESEITPKARLVARGFEEIQGPDFQTDSPTCGNESLKMILAVLSNYEWTPHAMDIKTAFLQGEEIERDIFIHPPKEAMAKGKLWKLRKCVYGLSDASLKWYNKVKQVFLELGATISKVDPAVFIWTDSTRELMGVLASHVDDFIWGGISKFERTVIQKLRTKFNVGKEGDEAFQYLGMKLEQKEQQIELHQNAYAENTTLIDITKHRAQQKTSNLTEEEKKTMRSKIGQVLWIARQTRPDVLFEACRLSSRVKDATVQDLIELNKVLKQVKSEKVTLKYQKLGRRDLSLMVFSDASLGNLPDGGTQGAYVIFLMNEDRRASPICWNSKKIRRVVRSTLAGETLATADAIDTGIYLSELYHELNPDIKEPLQLTCVTDCMSLNEAMKSTKMVTEKRLRIEIAGIKELMDKDKKIKAFIWSESSKQLADCLTKRGASPTTLLDALEQGCLKNL